MSYIGTPPSNAFTSLLKQDFSTSATTGYTLDHAVNNANDIALFINFVRQEPTAGYAASGTTLTLTSATASSDDMYCVYLGQALQTVNPANASVGTAQLIDGAVTSAKLASGAVANTPAFLVSGTTQTNVSDSTVTKAQFDTEDFDTNSNYDTSTYRFKPTTAGKYFLYARSRFFDDSDTNVIFSTELRIYKNGSNIARQQTRLSGTDGSQSTFFNVQNTESVSAIVEANGSSDYFEIFWEIKRGSSSVCDVINEKFGGYKIIE